jgi:hypothetical protein
LTSPSKWLTDPDDHRRDAILRSSRADLGTAAGLC